MSYQVSEYVSPGHPDKIADGDADGNVKSKFEIDLPTYQVIADLNLDKPGYFNRVRNGLFAGV